MQRSIVSIVIISILLWTPLWASKKIDEAEKYLQQAAKHYNNKKYARAEQAFQKVLDMGVPLHHEFYYQFGRVQLKNKKAEQALDSLNNYMQKAGKKGRFYQKAKSLSAKIEQQLEKSSKPKSSKKKKSSSRALGIGTPQMVRIKKGVFIMGAKWGDEDQKPPFSLRIKKDFAISKNEITFEQYDRFAKATNRALPDDEGWGRGKRPVINVSFFDAVAYTEWLSQRNKRTYRLPTESEWEYVAKVKPKGKKKDQTFGHKELIGRGDANCEGGRYFWEKARTKEVASYEPSPAGVHDIYGNVWEWTCSAYTRKYDGNETRCLQLNKTEGKTIAVRGGSWRSHFRTLRPNIRYNNYPTFRNDDLGFRIVEELD